MAKINLTPIVNLTNNSSAVNNINTNNAKIAAAFENTLSRDGTTPNMMAADLDMNGNQIINLPAPNSNNSAARYIDVLNAIGGGTGSGNVPSGGTSGQVLTKVSSFPYDSTWATPVVPPTYTLPAASGSLGGVKAKSPVTNQFLTALDNAGNFSSAQPSASNLSDGVSGSGSVALVNSPFFTNPTVGTQSPGNNTGLAASTAFVTTALSGIQSKFAINPVDYGADPTGVNNSDAAMTAAWSALSTRGGWIQFPAGKFKFASKFDRSLPSSIRFSVTIAGAGDGVTELFWPNADGGMHFIYNSNGLGNDLRYQSMTIRDMSFVTGVAGGGTGLETTLNAGISDPYQYFQGQNIFTNLSFSGSDRGFGSSKYWTMCQRLVGLNHCRWTNCNYAGAQPTGTTCLGQGVYFAGNPGYYSILLDFNKCLWDMCDYACFYGPWVQGVTFTQCNWNAGNGAGTCGVKVLPDGGSILAQLFISDSQFDNGNFGVQGEGLMFNLNCTNTTFTVSRANGIGCALPVYMASLVGCVFGNFGSHSNITGLYMQGYGGSVIANSVFKELATGYNWANTVYPNKSTHNIFIDVSTPFVNASGSSTPGGQSY